MGGLLHGCQEWEGGVCLVCLLVSVVVVVGGVLWQQHGVQRRVVGGGGAGRGPSVGRTASVTVPGSDGGCHLQVIGGGGDDGESQDGGWSGKSN